MRHFELSHRPSLILLKVVGALLVLSAVNLLVTAAPHPSKKAREPVTFLTQPTSQVVQKGQVLDRESIDSMTKLQD